VEGPGYKFSYICTYFMVSSNPLARSKVIIVNCTSLVSRLIQKRRLLGCKHVWSILRRRTQYPGKGILFQSFFSLARWLHFVMFGKPGFNLDTALLRTLALFKKDASRSLSSSTFNHGCRLVLDLRETSCRYLSSFKYSWSSSLL
jgi:hypothetical protein